MDSKTIVKFNVVETSLQYKSSTQNNTTFKDISFSSYLKPENPQENDTELSIFDAQKYFSESNNETKDIKRRQQQQQQQQQQETTHDSISIPRLSSVSSVDGYGRNLRTRSYRATPTASSEASWNSQTGLLLNRPGSINVALNNSDQSNKRINSAAKKWFFARNICCTGQKSVQVKKVTSELEQNLYTKSNQSYKEKEPQNLSQKNSIESEKIVEIQQNKAISPSQHRISASGRPFIDGPVGFTFPTLKPSFNQATKPVLKGIIEKPIVNLRPDSLEMRIDNSVNARGCINPGSPITARDEDMGSDASSDLFEIESFSTQTTSYQMYRRRDSIDEDSAYNARKFVSSNGVSSIQYGRRSLDEPATPSVAATECYPPSEVSIDWSVATAEGFSVSASETRDFAALRRRMEEGGGGKKAVKCVAEGPPMFPLNVGGRPPRAANKPPLVSSHSARLSLVFTA